MESLLAEINQAVIEGDSPLVKEKVQQALDAGLEPGAVLHESLIPAMDQVGQLFEQGEYFVPEMLVAARAMQGGLGLLKPFLAKEGVKSAGKVIIGTVKGDLHDIGKNLVAMMLEGAGFEVVDLGTDVSPEKFIQAVSAEKPQLVGMSALLTTTMPAMKQVVQALVGGGLRDQVKVMVGGAPITPAYAESIGADAYAPDAANAARLAKQLVAVALP
jgi:5-methyltetrahydrofolate--homocysteine methyltransferase